MVNYTVENVHISFGVDSDSIKNHSLFLLAKSLFEVFNMYVDPFQLIVCYFLLTYSTLTIWI